MSWFHALRLGVVFALVLCLVAPVAAQEEPGDDEAPVWPPPIPGIEWVAGPCKGPLGSWAELQIPAGWHFTGASGARLYEAAMQNTSSPNEIGVVIPPAGDGWYSYFEFDESGYVKDDEKTSLDADDLLETLQAGNARGNEERKRQGWPTLELVGWAEPPHFDDDLKVLVWATKVQSGGKEFVNYDARLLGRSGVMKAGLVCDTDGFATALPQFKSLCRSHQFVTGQRYAEFKEGDRVAEYGLAALVTGGALAVAAKTGLLQKFWKFLVVGVAALIAGVKKMFGKGGGERRPRTRRTTTPT